MVANSFESFGKANKVKDQHKLKCKLQIYEIKEAPVFPLVSILTKIGIQ